jgi:ornithine cyclodeaminase/alanine dehydrogenase-like protein (mu-crystallin family)
VDAGEGQLLLMPSCAALRHVGVKVATVAPGNPGRGLPRIQATYLLYDRATLSLRATLDGTALTTLRTPAVSVAAVRAHLSGRALRVAVIGAGPQALGHAETLRAVLTVDAVQHLVRDPSRVDGVSGDPVLRLGTPEADAALRAADVVVCATSARVPLFGSALLRDDAVVIAIGSHEPDAREVDAALCARATVVVEDPATALREAGDVVLAIAEGALDAAELVPLRHLVRGGVAPDPSKPLLFKGVGMAWQDLVVAEAVLDGATWEARTCAR